MSIKLKSTEFVTDPLRNLEREGRTERRRSTLSSRSKSLDWRAGAKSPERSYRTDIWTNRIVDNKGADREPSRVLSTVQVYNTANPGSDKGVALTRGNRGQSLPSNLRSQSVSPGPKAGHSILERIEKLYGSSMADNTGDYNTRTQEPSFQKASLGGTFPRRFSSGEYRPSSSQSGESLAWTNFKESSVSSTPGINRTRPLSGQWNRDSGEEEGGSFQNTELSDIGTRSLDRARSRCTKAAQIRAARAAEEMAKTTQSNAVLEGISEVCPGTRETKTNTFEDKDQDWKRWSVKDRSTEKVEDQMEEKGRLWMKRDSTSDDVFESNSQKIQLKSNEKKPSATSVRNKINQFEALTQRAQTSAPRRTFSVPAHLSMPYERVQKSSSDRDLGTGKYRWERKEEGVTEIKKKYDDIERDKSIKKEQNLRTISVDETNLNMIKQGTEKESRNNKYSEEFKKYSKLKTTLDLPLKKDPYPVFPKDFNIDETDFSKIESPVDASDDDASSSSGSLKPDFAANSTASLGEKKHHISGSSAPVSDNDKTPTNTPDNSPFLSPTSAPQKTTTFDHQERETQNNTPKEETKTPTNENLDILPPLTSSNLPDLVNPNNMNGKKRVLDLNAWLDGLNPQIKVWGDDNDNDDDDDDDSTQKDEDSNYDSDSGESSVTVTSNMSNKSFSLSLADLCNFAGVDYESENDSDEWQSTGRRSASLSSDMSAFSHVSVLPTEELDKLIEDVRGIGDDNLQNYEDVHVVVLHKDMGVGLGFSLAGGVDQNKPVTVHKVFHSGVAAKEGSIREGDIVLSINGTALSGCAHWEALRVLKRAKSREMGVVVLKKPDVSKLMNGNANRGPVSTQVTETGQHMTVCLQKNIRDIGFSLEGGVGSSLGNKPLTVQKIFQGGPVEKVLPGDEVLEINGVSVVGMRRLEAWTLIRKLAPGPVNVVLRRHPLHQPLKT